MKTNENILSEFKGRWNCLEKDDVLKAMKEAQKEIVEHILQRVIKEYGESNFVQDDVLPLKDEIIKEIYGK